MKNYQKIRKRIKTILIVLLLVTLFLTVYQIYHIRFYYKMKPKSYNYCIFTNQYNCIKYSLNEKLELVRKEFDTHHLLFKTEGDIKSSPLFRSVYLNYNEDDLTLVKAYAHELTHIKYQTINETYTTYKSIIALIESSNEYLHYVGMNYANEVCSGRYINTNYDCGAQLLEYLNKN